MRMMAVRTGRPLAALVLCLGVIAAAAPAAGEAARITPAAKAAQPAKAPTKSAVKTKTTRKAAPKAAAKKKVAKKETQPLPPMAVEVAKWAVSTGDNHDLPFAVVDKGAAMVLIFDGKGKLVGAAPALVGSATGDDSAAGVGDRELSDIPMEDRTTPAGRFIGGYGPAAGQQRVLWIDYDTAISMHPVITTNPAEKRPERIKSPAPDDNRITHGCINVPSKFYTGVVRATFKKGPALFYILPDTKPLIEVLPDFYVYTLTKAAAPQQASSTPEEQPAPSAQS